MFGVSYTYNTSFEKYMLSIFSVHPCDKPAKAGCTDICEKKGAEDFVCKCKDPVLFKLLDDTKTCVKSMLRTTMKHLLNCKKNSRLFV